MKPITWSFFCDFMGRKEKYEGLALLFWHSDIHHITYGSEN